MRKYIFIISFVIGFNYCARTTTSGQASVNPQSTGEVVIKYSNYFTSGYIAVGKYIYMLQVSTNKPAGFSNTVFLKAIGGTIDSGQKSAYTWKVTGLPSWLELQEDSSSFKLKPKLTTDPATLSNTSITITATSNENKITSISVIIVVLNNSQATGTGEPNFSNAYSNTDTLLVSESVSDNDVSGTDNNGGCTLSNNSYQAILPGQEINAKAGVSSGDCYMIHVPVSTFKVSFSIRSLVADSVINNCTLTQSQNTSAVEGTNSVLDVCSTIINFKTFGEISSSWGVSDQKNMSTQSSNMGLFLSAWSNGDSSFVIPNIGSSESDTFIEKVSAVPVVWSFSSIFSDSNGFLNSNSVLKTEKCQPAKSYSNFEADTLCKDDPFTAGTQAWTLKPGWYFFKVHSKRLATVASAQPYSIKYEIDLN